MPIEAPSSDSPRHLPWAPGWTSPSLASSFAACLTVLLASSCAGGGGAASRAPEDPAGAQASVDAAEAALAAGDEVRALALFRRIATQGDLEAERRLRVLPGLARAQEQVGDFEGAVHSYAGALAEPEAVPGELRAELLARKGAVEAELQRWKPSAESFALAYAALEPDALDSTRIELLARRAYAQFSGDELDACIATLDEAEAIWAAASESQAERFSNYYFVGMMRFYRAAVLHRRFRDLPVRLPETQMAKDFEAKMALLQEAQAAYNRTIEIKHVYWVSAAGYQLGHLFEEFYDDLMYAPVPDWLEDRDRVVYYEELKEQLRPLVNKAIWVFEKNLEVARRLGYENDFTEQTQAALARLQSVLLAGDRGLGAPHPRLAPLAGSAGANGEGEVDAAELPPAEAKLYVPRPTPL